MKSLSKKSILLTAIVFLCSFAGMAQENSGTIFYDQAVHIQIDESQIPEQAREFVKNMPKEHHFRKQVIFNNKAALYKAAPELEAVDPNSQGHMARMREWMAREEDEKYVNLEKQEVVEQTEFFGRFFLIRDTVEQLSWKITGESKKILGYNCMKATTMKDSIPVEAWFTPQIAVPAGPYGAGQLPGMILELSSEIKTGRGNNVVSWIAQQIELGKVSKSTLKEPKKGKEVTREEFEQIQKEKMEEMKKEWGGKHGGHRPPHHMHH